MALNYVEMAQIGAIFAGILLLFVGIGLSKARKVKRAVFAEAEQWIGGAIGRFMQSLSAAAEEEGTNSSPGTGALSLGGFSITPETIKSIASLLQMAKEFGLIGGGQAGGGGFKP